VCPRAFSRLFGASRTRLASQRVIVRADDDFVTVCLETKPVAQHRRSWDVGQDIEHASHKKRVGRRRRYLRRRFCQEGRLEVG
jgi:hypothetical protein